MVGVQLSREVVLDPAPLEPQVLGLELRSSELHVDAVERAEREAVRDGEIHVRRVERHAFRGRRSVAGATIGA